MVIVLFVATVSMVGETLVFGGANTHPLAIEVLESLNLTKETNATTWLQALLLVWCGYLSSVLARTEDRHSRGGWWFVALVAFSMGLDEVASLHERTIPLFREIFRGEGLTLFTWVIPGSVLAIVLILGLIRFDSLQSGRPFGILTQGALLFFAGAIGLEMLSALLATNEGYRGLPYFYVSTLEEIFESAGALRFAQGLGQRLSEKPRSLVVSPAAISWSFGASALLVALAGAVLELANYYQGGASKFMVEVAQFLNITQERNLPTYLSYGGLLALAWASWLLSRATSDRSWTALSALFLFLSLDEIGTLHERLEGLINGAVSLPTPLTRSWIFLVPIPLFVVYRWGRRAVQALDDEKRQTFYWGWLLFFGGTVFLKPITGWLHHGGGPVAFFLLALIEDMLKLAGCAFLLNSVYGALKGACQPIKIRFEE